jgi:peroxiredoxin
VADPAAVPAPAAISVVDVVGKLEALAAKNPEKLNWRVSIVDLMKLLDLDSSLAARKQLATELGCPAAKMGDSAQMNMWLHQSVLQKLAANGGNVPPFTFALAAALKSGPVVLYFYPAAFTKGCTVEAHEFAEATAKFNALGATVIGVSHDDIDTLNKFSVTECRNKFAVAADPDLKIAKSYDARIPLVSYANRTSYVIAPTGKIIYAYSALSPDEHVANTLAAVTQWRSEHPSS